MGASLPSRRRRRRRRRLAADAVDFHCGDCAAMASPRRDGSAAAAAGTACKPRRAPSDSESVRAAGRRAPSRLSDRSNRSAARPAEALPRLWRATPRPADRTAARATSRAGLRDDIRVVTYCAPPSGAPTAGVVLRRRCGIRTAPARSTAPGKHARLQVCADGWQRPFCPATSTRGTARPAARPELVWPAATVQRREDDKRSVQTSATASTTASTSACWLLRPAVYAVS